MRVGTYRSSYLGYENLCVETCSGRWTRSYDTDNSTTYGLGYSWSAYCSRSAVTYTDVRGGYRERRTSMTNYYPDCS